MKKRIISFVLVVALMVSGMAIPTSAVAALPGGVAAGATNVVVNSAFADAVKELCQDASAQLGEDATADFVQRTLNALVAMVGVGNMPHETLVQKCASLNEIASDPFKYSEFLYEIAFESDIANPPSIDVFRRILVYVLAYKADLVDWKVVPHSEYGYVITNSNEDFVLCDSLGRFPYALEITDVWFPETTALKNTSLHVATPYMLDNLQAQQEALHPEYSLSQVTIRFSDGNRYKVIKNNMPGAVGSLILCDAQGFPYGIPEGNTQMGGDRDYNDDKEEQPETSDEPIVDIDGNLVMQMFPDGSFTWINSLIYDAANKTYNIDASSTYNIEENTYYNFEWHYTYHIDYTSITYIGQTEEYNKYYEYYYDLPDGRSSADLTAEELLALNVAVDVVPYIRSADDTSIRALYHFDGDVRDSSYWNYLGEFQWNKGASITYMDAGVFEGALYLDETDHDFTIKLPSNISTSDFTLQFRYYQSYTAAPQTDSYVQIGTNKLIQFTGAQFLTSSGSLLGATSIGNWQEICIQRKNGETKWFLNGVPVGTGTGYSGVSFGNEIQFVFGSSQQTYKYFDEFRFTHKALYDTSGYTPSAVPFDTNLSLVLPDSKVPVADEHWVWDTTITPIQSFDFTTGVNPNSSLITGRNMGIKTSFPLYPSWAYNSTAYTQMSFNEGYATLKRTTSNVYDDQSKFDGGLVTRVGWYRGSSENQFNLSSGSYVISVVDVDGNIYSLPFTVPSTWSSSISSQAWKPYVDFEWGRIGLYCPYSTNAYGWSVVLCIMPKANVDFDIVYMELVKGTQPNTGHEYVTGVVGLDADDLNTPTLAVRTDLDITGYQLGGVRPSLPEKGLVWGLVEDSRITSLQIYNGQAWEQVDGRIWTGSRWVPYYAYDVLLLKDLYDIYESDPSLDYIYTEAGFWKWLQSAWQDMIKRLDAILAALGGSVTDSPEDETLPGEEDNPDTEEDEGWKFIDLLVILRDGTWKVVKGVVSVGVGGITGLADSVTSMDLTIFSPPKTQKNRKFTDYLFFKRRRLWYNVGRLDNCAYFGVGF